MHVWGMLGKLFIFAIESDFHSGVNPIQTNDEYRLMQQQICSKYKWYECEAKIYCQQMRLSLTKATCTSLNQINTSKDENTQQYYINAEFFVFLQIRRNKTFVANDPWWHHNENLNCFAFNIGS